MRGWISWKFTLQNHAHDSTRSIVAKPIFHWIFSSFDRVLHMVGNNRNRHRRHRYQSEAIYQFLERCHVNDNPCNRMVTITRPALVQNDVEALNTLQRYLRCLRDLLIKVNLKLHYLWVGGAGHNLGVHFHVLLFWPTRLFSDFIELNQRFWDVEFSEPKYIFSNLLSACKSISVQPVDLNYDSYQSLAGYFASHSVKHNRVISTRTFGRSGN